MSKAIEEITNKLFKELESETSEEARENIINNIINENKDFIWFILYRSYGRNLYMMCAKRRITPEDVHAVGMECLYKAVCTFDSSKGTKFTTLAGTIIYNAVSKVFRDSMKVEKDSSLDKAIFTNELGEETSLLHLIPDQKDSIYDFIQADAHSTFMKVLADKLDDRERKLLTMRFHLNLNQTQIATELGVTQMHVSRLLRTLLKKSRKVYEELERSA